MLVNLENDSEYEMWKKRKFSHYPINPNEIKIKINDIRALEARELIKLKDISQMYNYVFYSLEEAIKKEELLMLCKQANLMDFVQNPNADSQGISEIKNEAAGEKFSKYIPYTNKKLNWHTDGYYDHDLFSIKSFILHCVNPADKGGENIVLDHEMLYIALRDKNTNFISFLMENDVMKIPRDNNVVNSQDVIGPVFKIDKNNKICLRYTMRERNIIWKKDKMIDKITKFIKEFLEDDNQFKLRVLLNRNEGLIANNILHKREAFSDNKEERLFYRIRFKNRIFSNASD